MEPITELILQATMNPEDLVRVTSGIGPQGNLEVMECSTGAVTEEYLDHQDYKHITRLHKELGKTCLLCLIRKHYRGDEQFRRWPDAKGVALEVEIWS